MTAFLHEPTLRSMAPHDVEAVHVIHTLCLQRTLLGAYTREQIDAWLTGRTPQGYLRAAASGEMFLIAEQEDAVIGYASWRDEELLSLFVHPDFHGHGIGSALIAACFHRAREGDGRISKVKSVLGAEGFYRHHGFKIIGPGSTVKRGINIPDTRMTRAFTPKATSGSIC